MKIKFSKSDYAFKSVLFGVISQIIISGPLLGKESTLLNPLEYSIQQQTTISGTVLSETDGLPIPGVNVLVKGVSGMGTVTDFDGNFTLNVPSSESVLVFSFVGFQTIERRVGTNTSFTIQLKTDETSLEEVVVIGYGQQKKESVVAAIAQASGEDLERAGNVPNVGSALAGNVPVQGFPELKTQEFISEDKVLGMILVL